MIIIYIQYTNTITCFRLTYALCLLCVEEWTTTKKVINHKTRQTETRVQRQIVMEDGKVIADSGPQVTTRTNEDNNQEEVESTSKKKNGDSNKAPGHGYIRVPGSEQVVSEKVETRSKTREAKQEQLQYHDEGLRELTGFEVHKKALVAPNDLIELREELDSGPKGNLTHYSSKTRKTCDKEEIKEIGKLHRDGERTNEVTRTLHHEECDDDEVPEYETEGIQMPEAFRETSRKVQYHKNYLDEEEEDKFDRQNSKKLAIANVERYHDKDSKYDTNTKNMSTSTTNKWVESHFGSESDYSGSGRSSGSDDIIRKSRTKAGGNVIHIEMESRRSPAPSNRSYLDRERDTFTSRTLGQTTSATNQHIKQHEQATQLRSSSRGSSPSPPQSPSVVKHNPDPVHLYTYSPTPRAVSSQRHANGTPTNGVRQHRIVYEGDQNDYRQYKYRVEGNTSTNRSKSPAGRRSKSPASQRAKSPASVISVTTVTKENVRSGRSTPSKTFCFGDGNDYTYHRNVANERLQEVNNNARKGTVYHSVRPA